MTELIRQMRELADAIRSNNFLPTVRAKMADLADSMGDILTNVETRVANVELSNANTVASEGSRVSAENARVSAENSRKSAETARVNAEASRVSAENTRVSQENSRKSTESARVTEEGKRVTAENARASAETTRGNAESTRNSNENSRKSAETARVSAENTRVSTENTRANNESSRVSAENTRVGNENIRRTNEESRQQTFANQEARLVDLEGRVYRGRRDVLYNAIASQGGSDPVVIGASNQIVTAKCKYPEGSGISNNAYYDEFQIFCKDEGIGPVEGRQTVIIMECDTYWKLGVQDSRHIDLVVSGGNWFGVRCQQAITSANNPKIYKVIGIKY